MVQGFSMVVGHSFEIQENIRGFKFRDMGLLKFMYENFYMERY